MRRRVEQWSEQHGIAYLPREGRRSWTVSCLKLPEGNTSKSIVAALKQAGWTIGAGYGSLKESTIRIGHMSDHHHPHAHATSPASCWRCSRGSWHERAGGGGGPPDGGETGRASCR